MKNENEYSGNSPFKPSQLRKQDGQKKIIRMVAIAKLMSKKLDNLYHIALLALLLFFFMGFTMNGI
ncbi:hypothetical protein [Algoriphagus sp.]|uniref:hypothetical protein n=1 Tax=Algoriphagus sp. TaxID=1872435 RepID=UPI003F6F11D8